MSRNEAIGQFWTALCNLAEHEDGSWSAASLLCAGIEQVRVGNLPIITEIASDADWWASHTTPIDLEAYLTAINRHLPETPIHHKARKRIFAAMFLSLSADDRQAALAWAQEQTT